MSGDVNTMNLEQFKDCVLFSVTLKRWGNRAQIKDQTKLAEYLRLLNEGEGGTSESRLLAAPGGSKKRISSSKVLVKSPALDALNTHLTNTKKRCLALAMPSFIREGMFVVRTSQIPAVEEQLNAAVNRMNEELLPEFISEFPARIQDSKDLAVKQGGLGPLFDPNDYPKGTEMADKFAIRWNWLALTVPEGLPPELREQESAKLKRQFADAATEIKDALRIMFSELIDHAVDRLKTAPGEKPKVFRNSFTQNINDFFASFEARNIMDDAELSGLVEKAREAMQGATAGVLRADLSFREQVASKLTEIKGALDPMIESAKTRAFDFSED